MIEFLDTNFIIYVVESYPKFSPKARKRLGASVLTGNSLMISDLTRMECLVGPLKTGNVVLQADYEKFFCTTTVVPITAAVCDRAARIRAFHNLKAMDALQLAAAIEHGANTFLTADARLGSFPDITVEILR